MSGYVDTIILEANRQNSQQVGEAQSNAEWTNEVSSGVKLNVGDKISVHSAFVSDLGAEDSTIEFKGAVVQEEQKFMITKITPVIYPDVIFKASELYSPNVYRRKFAGETIEEIPKTIHNVKDNQANIVLSYYTSLNGEYVQTLPLNYTIGTEDKVAWTVVRGNISQTAVNTANNGLCLNILQHKILYDDKVKLGDDIVGTQAHQDGSRCMIFGRPKVSYFEIPSDIKTVNGQLVDTGVPKNRDLFGYQVSLIKIRQLLELEVPLGFNSPSEIGSVITDLLQKNTEIDVDGHLFLGARTSVNLGFGGENTKIPYGSSNETSTNKLFNCASFEDTQKSGAEAFYGKVSQAPLFAGDAVRVYEAGFQYVGIKRPEFYISGLELRDSILSVMTTLTNPQLIKPTMPDFTDTISFTQKTPPGSLTNQFPLFDIPSNAPIIGGIVRYPNIVNIPSQLDDSWHRDNLNPLFTNFLQENPFGNWYEATGALIPIPPVQSVDGYEIEESVTAGALQILLKIPFVTAFGKRYYTRPILNQFNLTTEGMVLTCPGKPITPVDANIIKIETVEQTIGIPSLRITVATGTVIPTMPVGEPIVIKRYDKQYFPPKPVPSEICLPTPYSVLHTSIEFTLDNLKKIFRYFKTQERTPELNTLKGVMTDSFFYSNYNVFERLYYNGELITPDTHRLFHSQGVKNSQMPKELGLQNTVAEGSPLSILNTTSDAYEGSKRDKQSDNVSTSFGYDNQPGFFTDKGTAHNTVNTSDIDFSSLPFYVKYFKDIAESRDWENMTQEEFDSEVFQNGENIKQERCSSDTLRESITNRLWGGFAVRTPSTCQLVPQVQGGKRVFENFTGTIGANMALFKSYDNNKFLREVDFTTNTNVREDWKKTYTKSVYDCISFVCQMPYANAKNTTTEEVKKSAYMKLEEIHTQVNEFGMYDPTITPVLRKILTPYKIDWWADVLDVAAGTLDPVVDPTRIQLLTDTRRFGYDSHPTAYGNLFTGLYNGIQGPHGCAPKGEYEVAVDAKFYNNDARNLNAWNKDADGYAQAQPVYVSEFITDVFIGASAPEYSFDTTTDRFSFSGLHTPEKITAKYNATLIMSKIETGAGGALATGPVPIPDNLGKNCYRINKEMDRRNFCPSITPYFDDIGLKISGTQEKALFPYRNPYIKAGKIIDSHSGIFLDQFGIDEKNWNRSFWGICGFSYNDLNTSESKGSINERILSGQLNNISLITTNQDVENSSIDEWFGPLTGVANHKPCLPFPVVAHFDANQDTGTPTPPVGKTTKFQFTSPIEVESVSARVEATNLPTKTLRPYFTIRSDIITDDKYYGHDKAVMPVLEVLQKESQFGDFFYGQGTTEFTNTFPRTITSIKTQICDPSGQLSTLSDNSAVLYKIQKINNASLNVAEEVLQNLKKK